MPAPAFIQSLLSSFPLYQYPEQLVAASPSYPAAPSEPTFWLHGPGVSQETESFDVDCLKAQAEARFAGIKTETRWLESSEGAPGAVLPALHLPNGDLLPAKAISGWIAKQRGQEQASTSKQDEDEGGYAVEKQDENEKETEKLKGESVNLQSRTYTSLIESKLQPALLAHLFLNPKVYSNLTIPLYFPQTLAHSTPDRPTYPILTRYAYSALSNSRKLEVQAELADKVAPGSSSGSSPSGSVGSWLSMAKGKGRVDLEEVQRQGEEVLDLLEGKLENEGRGWFFGTEQPTAVDALLYANLHIVYILHAPHLDAANPLRRKLEKCPQLFRWVKRLHKDYF